MTFVESIKTCLMQKYADFDGRATRSEYWWFYLFYLLSYIGIAIVDGMITGGIIAIIYSLGMLIPSITAGVRRLHDTDRVGWWLLIVLIPLIGAIVLIVFLAQKGTPGPNRFGPPAGEAVALTPRV